MVEDRRNDIGTKVVLAIYSAGMAAVIGLFVHAAWATASKGETKADNAILITTDLKERVTRLETYYINQKEILERIERNIFEIRKSGKL